MQIALRAVFPPECLACGDQVDTDFALCGSCWSEAPFIHGAACASCGTPLPGEDDQALRCDDCLRLARPWRQGGAVFRYGGTARKLILGLKHGDRAEVAIAAGPWLARRASRFRATDPLIVPVPLHWRRLLRRRFNQSAHLARAMAREMGCATLPDALIRARNTISQEGLDQGARFDNLSEAIRPHQKRGARLAGRDVIVVDDVMTSGATFSAATQACHAAGAENVFVISLARVARDA